MTQELRPQTPYSVIERLIAVRREDEETVDETVARLIQKSTMLDKIGDMLASKAEDGERLLNTLERIIEGIKEKPEAKFDAILTTKITKHVHNFTTLTGTPSNIKGNPPFFQLSIVGTTNDSYSNMLLKIIKDHLYPETKDPFPVRFLSSETGKTRPATEEDKQYLDKLEEVLREAADEDPGEDFEHEYILPGKGEQIK